MAYNLESLVQILEQMLLPEDHCRRWFLDPNRRSLIESLLTKATVLKDFLENSSSITGPKVRSLESQIRDAAYHVEDVIESHLADELLSRKKGESVMVSPPADLLQTIEDCKFERLLDKMVDIMEGRQMMSGASSSHLVSPRQDLNQSKIVVGISEDLDQVKDRLTGQQSKLEIIPNVGMGGIGKTTLAQTVFDDPFIASHFDTRAWTIISPSYNVREIVIDLLQYISGKLKTKMLQKGDDELALQLYQTLCGRRYLIVFDDVWSSKIWEDTKMCFPNESNGSRILVTTREQSMANDVGSHDLHHHVNFLNEDESWNLLCRKVFAKENCPWELEDVGEIIARNCRGHPLAIHAISGVLSQLGRTRESWVQVAKDVCSYVVDNNEQFSNILSLSYDHLPNYLKPCFLYMSVFSKGTEIRSSKLINLWIAEGFLKIKSNQSLEEVAEEYLMELVKRNLLLIGQQETKRTVKSCLMHDLLRDLCIRKAWEENFLYVAIDGGLGISLKELPQMRRLSIHTSYDHLTSIVKSTNLASVTRSFLFFGSYPMSYSRQGFEIPCLDVFRLQLLRVLDILTLKLGKLPKPMENLVNLRYLAWSSPFTGIPSWISKFCNLQTFIFHQDRLGHWQFDEIAELLLDLVQLRHIKFKVHYPLLHLRDGEGIAIQENLQSLSTIGIDDSFPKLLEALPNLKCLGIYKHPNISISSIIDLTCLSKLEALKCKCGSAQLPRASSLLSFLILPPSLKKLTLTGCWIPLGYMERVGVLPTLQILKLQRCVFESLAWEPNEGIFCQLWLLVLERVDMVKWIVNDTHYPRLEHLIIRSCSELEEMPYAIGEISTLEIIELHGASTYSALDSLRKIQDEQTKWGNDALQVVINAYAKRLGLIDEGD